MIFPIENSALRLKIWLIYTWTLKILELEEKSIQESDCPELKLVIGVIEMFLYTFMYLYIMF